MALRDQPYLPLYVQDFMTDEKLIECSAETTGVYIRLLCVFHKSEEYGKFLLKQKDKQEAEQEKNFALKLARQMPYSYHVIEKSLRELIFEGVVQVDGDYLLQKRMVRDNEISILRANSGKKGGKRTQNAFKFALAKVKANSENENENENKDINKKEKGKRIVKEKGKNERFEKPMVEQIKQYCQERENTIDPETFFDYYEANGWRVGKNPMSSWKAAVRTWEKKNKTTKSKLSGLTTTGLDPERFPGIVAWKKQKQAELEAEENGKI